MRHFIEEIKDLPFGITDEEELENQVTNEEEE